MDERIGKHRVLRKLGQGGMGRVLLAESTGAGGFVRRVVLKQVRDVEDAELRRALLAEARVQATLVHRNIVPVLDLDDHEGEHFVVLEYVDGMDLRRLLELHGTVPWRLALYIALEVASALEYAHRRTDSSGKPLGLVHRDVSPANILCSWEGEVKLTDFGIAKTGAALERGIVGNFAYISPEQASAEPVDARADIYSLGVVLYEAITGRNPFRHKNDKVTLVAVRAGVVPPISDLLAPADLRSIVLTMMARDRNLRFSDAARLREALIGVGQRMADPGPAFAGFLRSAQSRDKQPALRRIVEVGRAFTRRLTGTAPLSDVRDTVADAPRASRILPIAIAAIALAGAGLLWWALARRPSASQSVVLAPSAPSSPSPPVAAPTPRAPAPSPESLEPPRPRPSPRRPGSLSINSIPWSTVWVDERPLGHTPRLGLSLPPGKHRVRLRSAAGDERTKLIEIRPGEDRKLTVLFAEP